MPNAKMSPIGKAAPMTARNRPFRMNVPKELFVLGLLAAATAQGWTQETPTAVRQPSRVTRPTLTYTPLNVNGTRVDCFAVRKDGKVVVGSLMDGGSRIRLLNFDG